MKTYFILLGFVLLFDSCKIQPDSEREYDKDKVFRLQLTPAPGSAYSYEIMNETETEMKVEGKEITAVNESEIGLNYTVAIDSTGNYLFATSYDKIKIYTKSGDKEMEMDADNAMITIDPVERMLGILKSARIIVTVDSTGEVKNVTGYKELESKLMAGFAEHDQHSRNMAHAQWEKTVGDGIVKNTMEQLFKIFPDSAIHAGDTWKIDSRQGGELPMNIKSIYKLKAINDNVAIITSEGVMASDPQSRNVMGYSGVTADLKGKQKGEFQIETKTGILLNSRITADIDGILQVMGKEVPVSIKTSIKMSQEKAKK